MNVLTTFRTARLCTAVPALIGLLLLSLYSPHIHAQDDFAGFPVSPFNGAQLEFQGENLLVLVGGTGIERGVTFNANLATGFDAQYMPKLLTNSNILNMRIDGHLNGTTQQLSRAKVEKLPGNRTNFNVEWNPELDMGAEAWVYMLDVNNRIVGSFVIAPTQIVTCFGIIEFCAYRWRCDRKPNGGEVGFYNCFTSYVNFTVRHGGVTYQSVRTVYILGCPKNQPNWVSAAHFTGAGIPDFTLNDAMAQFDDGSPFVTNIGGARLVANKPEVTIEVNTGATESGACFMFDPSEEVRFDMGDGTAPPPQNATATVRGRGRVQGVADQEIGSVTSTTDAAGTVTLSAEFNGIGAPTFCVEVFNGADLVHTENGMVGQIGTVGSLCKAVCIATPDNDNPCIIMEFPQSVQINLATVPPTIVFGNRIVAKAKNPLETAENVAESDIVVNPNWGDITITNTDNVQDFVFTEGFPIVPLGGAETVEPAGGGLQVNPSPDIVLNPGVDEPDFGVCFGANNATGFEARVEPMVIPNGAAVNCIARGEMAGSNNPVIVNSNVSAPITSGEDGSLQVTWAQELNANNIEFVLVDEDGVVQASGITGNGTVFTIVTPDEVNICRKRVRCDPRDADGFFWLCFTFYTPLIIVDPVTGTEVGNITEIWIIAQEGPNPPPDVVIQEFDVVAVGMPDGAPGFTINDASVQWEDQGVFTYNLGNARLTADNPTIVIDNFSEGDGLEDGGCFAVEDPATGSEPTDATLEFEPTEEQPRDGGRMYFRAIGQITSTTACVTIGTICTEQNGGKFTITSDFSPVGSNQFNVEILNGMTVVTSATCLSVTVACVFTGCKSAGVSVSALVDPCIVIEFPFVTAIEIPGFPIANGNKIVIKPKDPDVEIEFIKEVDILANRNWAPITVGGVNTQPIVVSSVEDRKEYIAKNKLFALYPNYPNPFPKSTEISFELMQAAHVMLAVYDLSGNRIANLAQGTMQPGKHSFSWNAMDSQGTPVQSGVYFYRLEAMNFVNGNVLSRTMQMTVTR